jgi:nucleotide-binding universal stress UspA family protein
MTYKTLLVHLQSGQTNIPLLAVAGQFADRFKAHVIGIAACQPMMVVGGYGTVCGDVYTDDRRQITADLDAAQAEFRDALRGRSTWLEWRSETTILPPASYLSVHARSADLIMTGSLPPDALGLSRAADSGSLVMESGRPVYIVPAEAQAMQFRGAIIGWKDTRECRRATADALPLLKQTERVTVLEVAAIDDLDAAQARVRDVVTWLERHGVLADTRIEPSSGNDAGQLHAAADEANADVIVAGAYGHSRLREWVIGGVTRDLLLECRRGVLVSH